MRISDWSSDVCSSDLLIELEAQLHEKGVTLSTTPAARDWLARNGFDPLMGARPMARLLQDKITRPLADELLFGKLVNGGRVGVDAVDDRSEEQTSELQSLMRISYDVFCLKQKKNKKAKHNKKKNK